MGVAHFEDFTGIKIPFSVNLSNSLFSLSCILNGIIFKCKFCHVRFYCFTSVVRDVVFMYVIDCESSVPCCLYVLKWSRRLVFWNIPNRLPCLPVHETILWFTVYFHDVQSQTRIAISRFYPDVNIPDSTCWIFIKWLKPYVRGSTLCLGEKLLRLFRADQAYCRSCIHLEFHPVLFHLESHDEFLSPWCGVDRTYLFDRIRCFSLLVKINSSDSFCGRNYTLCFY